MFNTGYLLDERYEIINRIGQGGMSYVFRAKDTKLGRDVAIKVLKEEFSDDEDFVARFKNEASSAARLSHPNIVSVYDIVDSGEYHYIVMELVEGITLKNYITRKKVLTNKETIGIAIQAAEGIDEAHRSGIVHRDIKPQNIIISKDGKIKVADFGIAKAVTGDTLNTKAVIGSAHYISPEQAKTGESDARSDLYSLGISMYEMITGRVPYEGDNTVTIVMAHIQNAMVPPSVYNHEIYPALNDIIIKATKKSPSDRYQTARELIDDLKRASNDPEGHFVHLYETEENTSTPAEEAKPDDTQDEENPDGNNEQGDSVPERDERKVLDEIQKVGQKKRRMIYLLILCIVALFVLTITALVLLKRDGDRKIDIAEQETESAAESTGSETETQTDYTLSIHDENLMPDLIGLTVDEAQEKIADLDLTLDSSTTAFSDDYAKGIIINQNPAKSEVLASDTVVYVTVSLGSEKQYILSNLKNMSTEAAEAELRRAGFDIFPETGSVFRDDVAEGFVCGYAFIGRNGEVIEEVLDSDEDSQEDPENRVRSHTIQLIVSRGKESDYCQMPDLSGYTKREASELLENCGLKEGILSALNTDRYASGEVVGQSVAAGDYAKLGTAVDLQISVGSTGEVPDGTILSGSETSAAETGQSSSGSQLSGDYYYGSIDTICTVGNTGGPGTESEIMVGIRLAQRVNDSMEYTLLTEPFPVAAGDRIPVTFRNIRGAFGVDTGAIEVYNVNTNQIYSTYVIDFRELSQG